MSIAEQEQTAELPAIDASSAVPVTIGDIGKMVIVSNDGINWESRELARIVVIDEHEYDPESNNDDSGEQVLSMFVCWESDNSMIVTGWAMARLMPASNSVKSLLTRYAESKLVITGMEQEVKQRKQALESLESMIVEQWGAEGCETQRIVLSTGQRVSLYLTRKLYCNVPTMNKAALVEAVRDVGREDLIVTEVPTTRLKAAAKEWLGEGEDGKSDFSLVPQEIFELVNMTEATRLSMRKL